MQVKNCKSCGKLFEYNRDDAEFCEPRCAAQWARDEGAFRERFHEQKAEVHEAQCEWCGASFFYNDYAQRTGVRQAKYCSNKHRQAAYRARKGAFAGKTSHWDDARDNKKQRTTGGVGSGTERERQDYQDQKRADEQWRKAQSEGPGKKDTSRNQKKQDKDTSQNQAHKDTSHADGKDTSQDKRWKSKDAYVVLGVTYVSNQAQIKRAYIKLITEWHPDRCKHPDATRIAQAINAAWDKLKR